MAVLNYDPEMMEALGFTPRSVKKWKRLLAMRPIYEAQ
jgi:hypothetical protein